MNPWVVPLAVLCGLVLTATGLSLFALWRAHHLLTQIAQPDGASHAVQDGEVQELRRSLVTLAAQLRDLERHPPVAAPPGLPRPGMNLSKRAQALRMHRQGESPEQIAVSLDLPRQEVELLLKVHRIVIANL